MSARVNIREILANNLRDHRGRAKLTQETLAWKSKISPDFIGRIERAERTISLDNLERIAKVLKVPVHVLLTPTSHESN